MSSLFYSILPPEKVAAIERGEKVEITGEESKRFQLAFDAAQREEKAWLRVERDHYRYGLMRLRDMLLASQCPSDALLDVITKALTV